MINTSFSKILLSETSLLVLCAPSSHVPLRKILSQPKQLTKNRKVVHVSVKSLEFEEIVNSKSGGSCGKVIELMASDLYHEMSVILTRIY